jgi:outer membrane biogenesis lipoprotein LolB
MLARFTFLALVSLLLAGCASPTTLSADQAASAELAPARAPLGSRIKSRSPGATASYTVGGEAATREARADQLKVEAPGLDSK